MELLSRTAGGGMKSHGRQGEMSALPCKAGHATTFWSSKSIPGNRLNYMKSLIVSHSGPMQMAISCSPTLYTPKKMSAYVQRKTCTRIIKAVLFIIVSKRQKAEFLTWSSHTMEKYTAMTSSYHRPQEWSHRYNEWKKPDTKGVILDGSI